MIDEATQGHHAAYQRVPSPVPPPAGWWAGYPALWRGGQEWAGAALQQACAAGAFVRMWTREADR